MKQLTCEMCGSSDLIKQDGVFVCQSCGCKYSVEEAKKMMVEGTVEVQGTVKLDSSEELKNLYELARSSFDSCNYEKCEEFCNQIIAMDSQNFAAWKLKGDAITYQISMENRRDLEAYNCIMSSYDLLNGEKKNELQTDILSSLKECFRVGVHIGLGTLFFKEPHLSDSTITNIKKSYKSSYDYVADLLNYMELNETKNIHLNSLKNIFVSFAHEVIVKMRDIIKISQTTNKEQYLKDTTKLLDFMHFVEEQINDDTPYLWKSVTYKHILFFQIVLESYKTDEEKTILQNSIKHYKEKFANEIYNYIKDDSKSISDNEIFLKFKENINKKDFVVSEAYADIYIERNPSSQVGYLGKALAIYGGGNFAIERDDKVILELLKKALEFSCSNVEKNYLHFIVNVGVGEYKKTLLILATSCYDFKLVEFLVDVGADVNFVTEDETNALWYICSKKVEDSNLDSCKKITKLFIDSGSNIDIKSKSGIDLYNKNTHPEIVAIIKEKFPEIEKGSSSGCYIATAVYGSYDCPQVWTLRRYRDYSLAETWYGRAFIRTYYAISPTLVKWFGHTPWFKNMWKGKLDKMVADLQEKGFESTPYNDRKY